MILVTRQAFLELVDGVRSIFTAAQAFVPNSVLVFQGSLAVNPLAYIEVPETQQVCFLDAASRATCTVDTETDFTLVSIAHTVSEYDELTLFSDDTLPDGILGNILYLAHVVDEDHLQLTVVPDGAPVQFTDTGDGTLSYAYREIPLPADGALWHNAMVGIGVSTNVMADGLWLLEEFQAIFNIQASTFEYPSTPTELFETRLAYALHMASIRVRQFLQMYGCLDMYADAKSVTPIDAVRTEMFRYAETLLTFKMLLEEPGVLGKGPVAEHIEKFTDAISITKRYQAYGAQKITSMMKEDVETILLTLLYSYVTDADLPTTAMPYALSYSPPARRISYAEAVMGVNYETELYDVDGGVV